MKPLDNGKITKKYSGVVLVSEDDELILQQRENKRGISNPGLITTFGGVCKYGETHRDCVVREIEEELNYLLDPEALLSFLSLVKTEADGSLTFCEFYVYQNAVNVNELNLMEGEQIELMDTLNFTPENHNLSEVCKRVLNEYTKR